MNDGRSALDRGRTADALRDNLSCLVNYLYAAERGLDGSDQRRALDAIRAASACTDKLVDLTLSTASTPSDRDKVTRA